MSDGRLSLTMSSTGHDGSARTAKFDTTITGYEGEDVPPNVYVEVSADANDSLLAIIAAGTAGRYSFDFRLKRGRVEITEAYEEGMRIAEEELPTWMDAVVDDIEAVLAEAA